MEVDWPQIYEGSELKQYNVQHAEDLVDRDSKQCQPLVVQSEYAMPFRVQVGTQGTEGPGLSTLREDPHFLSINLHDHVHT